MTYVFALDEPPDLPAAELRSLLGGKAANLGVMARDLGLPVPPGFVISTDAGRRYLDDGWAPELDAEIRAAMERVEATVGRRFADPNDPLLVSVRSGAPVSMPGMMDTILNLGITEANVAGLGRGTSGEAFARDSRARFGEQFRKVVGADPPDDPWVQLRGAIEAVFRSWQGDRAVAYRRREGIADDLGTAATVQAMVFGNRDQASATGVLFTRDPATGAATPYGDVMFGAQGEDVVAGTHRTEPIAVLDGRLPDAAQELRSAATRLERSFGDLCDIEFTIESGRLWLLQVRVGKRSPLAALRMAVEMAEDPDFPLTRAEAVRRVASLLARPPMATTIAGDPGVPPLAVGLPASPGVASGEIVTAPDAAERVAAEGRPVILVRAETSPEDVHGMARAAGIVTARGGIASHAAVVARGWGIPAVVGAEAVSVRPDGIAVNGTTIPTGELLTVDGDTGRVFRGRVEARAEVVPAAGTLLEWARELGIPIVPTESTATHASVAVGAPPDDVIPPGSGSTFKALSQDDAVRLLGVKGFATAEGSAEALGGSADEAKQALDDLVASGLATGTVGAYRLSEAGRERHRELVEAEGATLGEPGATGLLDGLLALDGAMKEIVTAWQLRPGPPGGEPVINDHSDSSYDADVLERLEALAEDADTWLASSESMLPRLSGYRGRLRRAIEKVRAGDHRYVASPRVDSFHEIWFELHEELILLAGRTRADEVAAGRA